MRVLLVEDDRRVAAALAVGAAPARLRGRARRHRRRGARGRPVRPGAARPEPARRRRHRRVPGAAPAQTSSVGIIAVTARGEERDRVIGPAGRRRRLRGQAVLDGRAAGPDRGGAAPGRARPRPAAADRSRPARCASTSPPARSPSTAEPITLTRKEFDMLASLARQPGVAVPRDRILLDVWQTTWSGRHTAGGARRLAARQARRARPGGDRPRGRLPAARAS